MASKDLVIDHHDFSGGINRSDDIAHLAANELYDMRNFTVDESGILVKRLGSAQLGNNTAGAPYSMFRGKIGSTLYLLVHIGTDLYAVNESTGAVTSLASGLSAGTVRFCEFESRIYFTHNSVLKYYDGTSVTALTGVNTLEAIMAHNNHVFCANNTSGTRYHYTSQKTTPDCLSGAQPPTGEAGYDYVDDAGVQKLNNFISTNGALMMLLSNSIHFLYGWDSSEFAEKKEVEGIGCIAPLSVAGGDGILFFMGADGVYWVRGSSVVNISDPINAMLNTYTLTEKATASGFCYDHKYYLALPSATGEADAKLVFVYDILASETQDKPVWVVHSGIGGADMCACNREADSGKLYSLTKSTTNSQVVEMFKAATYTDKGADIAAYAETGKLLGGQPNVWYLFDEVVIDADVPSGGSLTLTWTAYKGSGATSTGTISVTAAKRYGFPVACQGMDLKLKFSVSDAKAGWKLRGFTVKGKARWANR